MDIPAARFKAECLKLMDQVEKTRESIVITKHGRPVAKLAPLPADGHSLFGYMKDSLNVMRDIMAPVGEEWSAISGDEDRLYERVAPKRPRRKK